MKIRLSTWDKKFSTLVRERDGYRCQVRGLYDTHYVACHHVIGRANKRLRFELFNGISLCSKHHKFDSEFSAHGSPIAFREWFAKKYPDRWKLINLFKNEHRSERESVELFKLLLKAIDV